MINGIEVRAAIEFADSLAVTFDGFASRAAFRTAFRHPVPGYGLIEKFTVRGMKLSADFYLLPGNAYADVVNALFGEDDTLRRWSAVGDATRPIVLSDSQVELMLPPDLSASEVAGHIVTACELVTSYPFKAPKAGRDPRSLAATMDLRPKKVPAELRDAFEIACDWAINDEADLLDYAAEHPMEARAFVRLFAEKIPLIEKWAVVPKRGGVSAEATIFQVAAGNFAIMNQKLAQVNRTSQP